MKISVHAKQLASALLVLGALTLSLATPKRAAGNHCVEDQGYASWDCLDPCGVAFWHLCNIEYDDGADYSYCEQDPITICEGCEDEQGALNRYGFGDCIFPIH